MIWMTRVLVAAALATVATAAPHTQTPDDTPQPPQQPDEIVTTITSAGVGIAPRFAVPDFIAVTKDAETVEVASAIARVLYDDLDFEREFALIPRDVYVTVPAATSVFDVPLDRWLELNADGVVVGTVQKLETGVRVQVRLLNVRSRESVFAREYSGSIASARMYAHTIADELHESQRDLRGVARTKLTFNSDRDGEQMGGTVQNRGVKEIYISDYDGANQRRVTVQRSLNIMSTWSVDARSIAYVSYRRGLPQIFISNIYEGTLEELTKNSGNNMTPMWSPDGTRLAFASTMDGSGNTEIYVINRDGTNLRRLTNHPGADVTPTWSPSGTQIAFVSDRAGPPQIYAMSPEGLSLQRLTTEKSDRPTWSPPPYNEIAYAASTGPGFDIRILDLATREVKQLTFGEGTNESPSFAPNGRHIAFMSTRAGRAHIFTLSRTGQDLKQITRTGNNYQPHWSR